jgi:hypothetical protein
MMTRMTAGIARTVTAIQDGTDYTAIVGVMVALAGLVTEAAAQRDGLPPAISTAVAFAVPYARLIVLCGSAMAALGRSVVVRSAPAAP